jgi:DNA ligase 1
VVRIRAWAKTPIFLAACVPLSMPATCVSAAQAPPLMLANVYDADIDPAEYWISEKYDGVRAYWNGSALLTRSGNRIAAPEWFTAGWPGIALDGELWIGRRQFESVVATTRDSRPDEAAWRQIKFLVFDLPAHPGAFSERLASLQQLTGAMSVPWVEAAAQFKVADSDELHRILREVVAHGGEGLMLHRGSSRYRAERSDDLLKLKPQEDAEARVVAHLPGKGKYEGMLGALELERPDGLRLRVGSGFTDEQRRHPPAIGSWVTYSYHGVTAKGVPRFARFVRAREDFQPRP